MKLKLLAYSSDTEFMETLSSWFEQQEFYTFRPVSSLEDVPEILTGEIFDAVILNVTESDVPVTLLTCDLVEQQPGIKVLLYPPQNNPNHPDIKDVNAHRFLSKPFSADELTAALNELFAPPPLPLVEPIDREGTEAENNPVLPPDKLPDINPIEKSTDEGGSNSAEPTAPTEEIVSSSANVEDAPTTNGDIGFLAGWIVEDTGDESLPDAENEPPTAALDTDIEPSVNVDENLRLGVAEPDIAQISGDETGVLSETPQTEEPAIQSVEQVESASPDNVATTREDSEIFAPWGVSDFATTGTSQVTSPDETVALPQTAVSEDQAETAPLNVHSLRLNYSCVLIPRHPQQYLVRDLADRLGFILPQIHLSRGWRVTGISVRPLYLQWCITLPADTDPAEAINEIRQRTSIHFLTDFPELNPHESDQDFWAPGYLMLSGTQPMPPSVIQAFIDRARTLHQQEG